MSNPFQARLFLKQSYSKELDDVGTFKVDRSLSGQRAQVYNDPNTGETKVVHRGTNSLTDWITNTRYLLGNTTGKRFQHADKIQRQAELKYGKISETLGHSLGSLLSEKVGGRSKQVTTLNKPVSYYDIGKKIKKNQTDYKTNLDPVSPFRFTQRGNKAVYIKSKTYNPFIEHNTNVLGRLK